MTERDAVDERARRPAREGAGDVGRRVAPCAPTPGRSRIACGSSRRASPIARGCVAPTTAPTLERPRSPTRSSPQLGDEPRDVVPERAAVRERQVLDVGAAGVRRLDEAEDARRRARRQAARNGSSESRPRYGLTVSASASGRPPVARLEVRGRVGAGGRADVAALRVRDHEQPGGARVLADAARTRACPSAPSASKNAICGFTATAYGATASTIPQQKRANASARPRAPRCASPRSSTGSRSSARVEADDELAPLAARPPRRAGRRRSAARRRSASRSERHRRAG